jgi:hypothetical protein
MYAHCISDGIIPHFFCPPPPKKTHKEHVESNFKLTNYTIKMKTISHGKFYLSSFNILRVYFKP